jgi:hypothetical protein
MYVTSYRILRYIIAEYVLTEIKTFDAALMRNIRLIDAAATPTSKVVFEFDVLPAFCSKSNNMHGGAVACMFH